MNCKKFRARIFDGRDGTLSPGEMKKLNEHLEKCARCRREMENEAIIGPEFKESFSAATASLSFKLDPSRLARRIDKDPYSNRPSADSQAHEKFGILRWLAVGTGAAIVLAAIFFGTFKPGKDKAVSEGLANDEIASLRSDEPADPFRDWIEKRMIITIEDKAAGTTERYLTDRAGTIRKISGRGIER